MGAFETSAGPMPVDRTYTSAELAAVVELPETEFDALFEARRRAWVSRYMREHPLAASGGG